MTSITSRFQSAGTFQLAGVFIVVLVVLLIAGAIYACVLMDDFVKKTEGFDDRE